MIVLDGLPALSAFRLERLNRELSRALPRARITAAWHVYFVAGSDGALDVAHLADVLRAQPGPAKPARLWIVPRLGTISPWSTMPPEVRNPPPLWRKAPCR